MSYLLPISIKWILFEKEWIWLRFNERNEWELPGWRLEKWEQPQETIIRELEEELGFSTQVKNIINSYVYNIKVSDDLWKDILVIMYLCKKIAQVSDFEYIWEAWEAKFELIHISKIEEINMPLFYKESIIKAYTSIYNSVK